MRDFSTQQLPCLCLPFLSRVSARGLHTIDNADEFWQIELPDRLSESLRAHEECPRGRIHWIKRVGVLNPVNYYFPHTFGFLRVGSIRAGFPQGERDRSRPLDSAWQRRRRLPNSKPALASRVERRCFPVECFALWSDHRSSFLNEVWDKKSN
jgi:hypothetical protein